MPLLRTGAPAGALESAAPTGLVDFTLLWAGATLQISGIDLDTAAVLHARQGLNPNADGAPQKPIGAFEDTAPFKQAKERKTLEPGRLQRRVRNTLTRDLADDRDRPCRTGSRLSLRR